VLWLPLFTILALISALGIGIGISALNAKYRDIGYAVPFMMQLLMFLSPVLYPASSAFVPKGYRILYGLNPVVGAIEGFRWSLLGVGKPPGLMFLVSAIAACLLFVVALMYFRRL